VDTYTDVERNAYDETSLGVTTEWLVSLLRWLVLVFFAGMRLTIAGGEGFSPPTSVFDLPPLKAVQRKC